MPHVQPNLNKTLGLVFGVVFLAVGVLGFILNPTLIVFGVNALHNVVHLASGVVLLAGALAAGGKNAARVNATFGVVYLLVALLGFVAPGLTDSLLMSGADGFAFADAGLHAVLGIALLGAGLALKDSRPMATR